MNSNEIKSLAESLKLNNNQRQILVGLILGDGHLETQNKGKTFRLKVEHALNQKECVLTPPQIKLQTVGGIVRQKYWFSTISTGSFRFYGQLFYVDHKKVVPKMIVKLVETLTLAVWFMDDGSLKSQFHKARIINTQCFKISDLQRLQGMLLKKFNIPTTLRRQKEGSQIYIPSQSVERFVSLVKPYIIPSMEY